MPSIESITKEVVSINKSSEELAQMIGAASQVMGQNAQRISNIVQGSTSGMEAVSAVNTASRSLADAATSMKALCRTCDECAVNLAK